MGTIIPSASALSAVLDDLRRRSKKIVFTNGCFDLLHPGHVYTLTQAKALGDVLIVAINSDASVKRLKGASRPILNECERATILSALAAVDYVVVFSEDTPLELIRLVRPQVLVKGGDWSFDTIVGGTEVRGWGGTVERIPYQEGLSTTDIVARVLAAAASA